MKPFLLFFISTLALASEVTHTGVTLRHIVASQDPDLPFAVEDYLCAVQHGDEIACGFVEKIEPKGVLIDLEFRAEDVKVGSKIQRATTRRPCDPDFTFPSKMSDPYSRSCTEAEKTRATNFRVRASHFYSMGIGLMSPRVAGETTLANSFSAGVSLDLISFYSSLPSFYASAAGTAYGGTIFLGFYPNELFEGVFAQLSFGYYLGRMTLREDLNSWSGTAMGLRVGFRFLNWQGFGVGLSVSAQHFSFGNSETPTRTEFVYPGALIEFGGTF